MTEKPQCNKFELGYLAKWENEKKNNNFDHSKLVTLFEHNL